MRRGAVSCVGGRHRGHRVAAEPRRTAQNDAPRNATHGQRDSVISLPAGGKASARGIDVDPSMASSRAFPSPTSPVALAILGLNPEVGELLSSCRSTLQHQIDVLAPT